MNILVDAKTMQDLDDYTINEIGIPSLVLMERAALSFVNCMVKHISKNDKILAICGSGNNGADAIAAARILHLKGYDVNILLLSNINKCSEESITQINIAKKLGISLYNNIDINEYNIIIDGILGIGLNSKVRGKYLDYIVQINNGDNIVFSIDIPSGLSATSGKALGMAIQADYTITFGYNKIGLVLYPGCEIAGQVIVADIGFPEIKFDEKDIKHISYDQTDLCKMPTRTNDSHKGDYGKVLVIAGSTGMNGACYLASKGAYRTGSGLVKALVPEENRGIMQTMLPEAIVSTYQNGQTLSDSDLSQIIEDISWANVIVVGPGLGTHNISLELLKMVLENTKVPIVIDADGINLLGEIINNKENSESPEDRIQILKDLLPNNTIITPHLKELSRLLNIELSLIQDDILDIANTCTKNNSIIFVLKDARTIVAYENCRFINTRGNNGMSTAGSGDVLTGIIASLIGQGLNPSEGASLGVYIHGLAGDIAAKEKNQYSIIASDIIEGLAKI